MNEYELEKQKWESVIGRLIVAMNEIDNLVYSARQLLFEEQTSSKWRNKTCKQRLDGLIDRLSEDNPRQRALRCLLQEALSLNEIRNRVAHGNFLVEMDLRNASRTSLTLYSRNGDPDMSLENLQPASLRCAELSQSIFLAIATVARDKDGYVTTEWLKPDKDDS